MVFFLSFCLISLCHNVVLTLAASSSSSFTEYMGCPFKLNSYEVAGIGDKPPSRYGNPPTVGVFHEEVFNKLLAAIQQKYEFSFIRDVSYNTVDMFLKFYMNYKSASKKGVDFSTFYKNYNTDFYPVSRSVDLSLQVIDMVDKHIQTYYPDSPMRGVLAAVKPVSDLNDVHNMVLRPSQFESRTIEHVVALYEFEVVGDNHYKGYMVFDAGSNLSKPVIVNKFGANPVARDQSNTAGEVDGLQIFRHSPVGPRSNHIVVDVLWEDAHQYSYLIRASRAYCTFMRDTEMPQLLKPSREMKVGQNTNLSFDLSEASTGQVVVTLYAANETTVLVPQYPIMFTIGEKSLKMKNALLEDQKQCVAQLAKNFQKEKGSMLENLESIRKIVNDSDFLYALAMQDGLEMGWSS